MIPGDRLTILAARALQEAAESADSYRPRPYPIQLPPVVRQAVEQGTRTTTGRPGPNYWSQWARYDIQAEIDPATATLTGQGTIPTRAASARRRSSGLSGTRTGK